MALYVPLDADYYYDPRMIDAGPMAELLYVRGLCFAKRTEKDGFIAESQLKAIATGIPKPRALADRLVANGAWEKVDDGWQISAWLKRNKSAAQIAHAKEAARLKSLLGNHERWHVKEGKFDPTCEMCNPYHDPRRDPHGEASRDPKQSRGKRSEAEQSEAEQSEAKTSSFHAQDPKLGLSAEPRGIEGVVTELAARFRA